MTNVDEHGRPEPPDAADEQATLLGFLDYQRATFAWKTGGLDQAGVGAKIGASTMTLGGMVKHLALVEDYWFTQWLLGEELPAAWDSAELDEDPDWEWHSGATDPPEELQVFWAAAVDRSRQAVAQALETGDLGQLARRKSPEGHSPSLRWILCHMVEEYARHNGHADLLRESIDGQTGE